MATELISCNTFTAEGIRKLKICTQQTDGSPIEFPTDYTLYNNEDGIISISEDVSGQTVTIGNQTMNYLVLACFDLAEFEDNRQETRQGVWYEKKITMTIPKIMLDQSNEIVDFLFNVDGRYAIAECLILIEDSIGNTFIVGYDLPCILQTMEIQTDSYDSTENTYVLEFNSKSYSRLRRYQVV
jgi:hypothetical protein